MRQRISGMNARDALAYARELGCTVHPRRRTGEIVVVSRLGTVCINGRRKDSTRALTVLLRRLLETMPPANDNAG
jgi:hypothetical protein